MAYVSWYRVICPPKPNDAVDEEGQPVGPAWLESGAPPGQWGPEAEYKCRSDCEEDIDRQVAAAARVGHHVEGVAVARGWRPDKKK